jgi:hypothetical protein
MNIKRINIYYLLPLRAKDTFIHKKYINPPNANEITPTNPEIKAIFVLNFLCPSVSEWKFALCCCPSVQTPRNTSEVIIPITPIIIKIFNISGSPFNAIFQKKARPLGFMPN